MNRIFRTPSTLRTITLHDYIDKLANFKNNDNSPITISDIIKNLNSEDLHNLEDITDFVADIADDGIINNPENQFNFYENSDDLSFDDNTLYDSVEDTSIRNDKPEEKNQRPKPAQITPETKKNIITDINTHLDVINHAKSDAFNYLDIRTNISFLPSTITKYIMSYVNYINDTPIQDLTLYNLLSIINLDSDITGFLKNIKLIDVINQDDLKRLDNLLNKPLDNLTLEEYLSFDINVNSNAFNDLNNYCNTYSNELTKPGKIARLSASITIYAGKGLVVATVSGTFNMITSAIYSVGRGIKGIIGF